MADASAEVTARIKSEVAEVKGRIKRMERALPAQTKTADRLWAKYLRLPEGKTDPKLDAELAAAQAAQFHTIDGLSAEKRRLALLNDPDEVERRIAARQTQLDKNEEARMARKAATTEKKGTTTEKGTKTEKTEVSQELIDRIVKDILSGKGLTAVAKALTEEGVPTLGKSTKWHPPVVRGIFLKATGATGVKAVRDKNPVASKAAKDQPAKPAVKLEKAEKVEPEVTEVVEPEAEVKPDPKPTPRKRSSRKSPAKA